MKYLATAFIVCVTIILSGLPTPVHAATSCGLCIMEVQTQGAQGEEDQDFVVIANLSGSTVTASSSNPIRLQYYNDQGVAGSSMTIAASTIPKDQVYVLASSGLVAVNSGAQALTMPLYSGGGSLQLYRGATVVYDKVGWGSAVQVEGVSAPALQAGTTLARKRFEQAVQDTNNNNQDFYLHELGCRGQEITEIQPFVVDVIGQSIDAWIEIRSGQDSAASCALMTKAGDIYMITEADLARDSLNIVARGALPGGRLLPLHLGEVSGQIWLVALSQYSSVALPVATRAYSNLENGQSYALVEGIWRRTYSPTPGEANVYAPSTMTEGDSNACSTIRMSELLPNPVGEDGGHEWLEVTNESDQPAELKNCVVSVGGTEYHFLPDDVLGAHEWRAVHDFYDYEQNPKSLSLRNTDTALVAFQRLGANGSVETIQSFEYTDAPEGRAWARFSDGWRWNMPTPNENNTLGVSEDTPARPTEHPAGQQGNTPEPDQQGAAPLVNVRITELLPNPAAPGTDDADEFVELFNDEDAPVSLRGYKLQTGNSYNYSFTFTDEVMQPKSFMAVTSGASSISLANSGGRARLVTADGRVAHETMPYIDAPEGQAWALVDGVWKWTAQPTPGMVNTFKAPVLTALSKAKTSTAKSSSAVKSATKATSSAPKAPKTSATAATKPGDSSDQGAVTIPPLHPLILAVVGGLGVLYAAYEYRQDIANKIYQFRRDRKNRRSGRTPLEGR